MMEKNRTIDYVLRHQLKCLNQIQQGVLLACILFFSFSYSRRRAYSPQSFMSQDSEDSDLDEVSPYTIMPTTDSGSKIERILGRRVLPDTEEEAIILKRSRLAIVFLYILFAFIGDSQ